MCLILAPFGVADDAALHDPATRFRLGFQQTRVHVNASCAHAQRALQRLVSTDFTTSAVTAALFAYFAGLKGFTRAAIGEGTRQSGNNKRLADLLAGALQHDGGAASIKLDSSLRFDAQQNDASRVPSRSRGRRISINFGLALRPVTRTGSRAAVSRTPHDVAEPM